MNKILIWYTSELKNTGGPRGYLFNIHEYLKTNPSSQITFLVDLITPFKVKEPSHSKKSTLFKRLRNDFRVMSNLLWRYYNCKCPNLEKVNINDYDIIHIHGIVEYYRFKKKYPYYRGKVVLTNHTPCPWTYEQLATCDTFVNFVRPLAIYKECKAYKGSDYLMFPCKDAREPYEKNKQIRQTFNKIEKRFLYVPSSIMDIKINEDSILHFSDLGIPQDAFVITYFGRHNHIKGYDILKRVGETLLDKYPNLYFLCAGNGKIEPLKHPRWIELGFIKNTHELLYQGDLYISVNRETYFDLVVLEVLRSATFALLSDTGGNKYFKQYTNEPMSGIDYFDIENLQDLTSKVEDLVKCKANNPQRFSSQCQSNRILFLKLFTIEKYIERYIDTFNKL